LNLSQNISRHTSAPISIIVPTFNDQHYLKKCIESILDQSILPAEIIVVDDGSKNDDAQNLVKSLNLKALDIKFLKIKNSGPSIARNQGFKISSGEFLLFLDADDTLPPSALAFYANEINTLDSKFFGISGQMNNFGRIFNSKNRYIPEEKIDITKIGRKDGLQGQISCYLLRAEHFKIIGEFNSTLTHFEDFELLLRLFSRWKLKTINHVVLNKRFHKKSLSNINFLKSFEGGKKFLSLARRDSLLPEVEILRREKENFLSLGKRLLLNANLDKSFHVFKDCFDCFPPSGFKEFFILLLAKLYFGAKSVLLSK